MSLQPVGQAGPAPGRKPGPASNFKTHGANVTHMEFRHAGFYLVLLPPREDAITIGNRE